MASFYLIQYREIDSKRHIGYRDATRLKTATSKEDNG